MTLQDIGLEPRLLRAVERKARSLGQTTPQYVRSLIERSVLADKSFDEMLAPVRADVSKQGLSERRLDQIVHRARKSLRRKSQGARR